MPIDGQGTRLLRTALLAKELAKRGHSITYWNASFNHQKKRQRADQTFRARQDDSYDAIFLKGRPYRNNLSLSRIVSHHENAVEFKRLAPQEPVPDLVLCGFPPIELSAAACRYAADRSIPCIVDARDMWPEVIEAALPPIVKMAAFPILSHWRKKRNAAFASATSITGVSDAFVDWACSAAYRPRRANDKTFFLAADTAAYSASEMQAAHQYWNEAIGEYDPACTMVLMAGNLSKRVDIMTAVRGSAEVARRNGNSFKLIVCGKGDLENEISTFAANNPSVHFAGWRKGAELKALSERCSAGMLAYSNVADLSASFPNKVGEYLSYGLPIISCLGGETRRLLASRGILVPYDEGDVESVANAYRTVMDGTTQETKSAVNTAFLDFFEPSTIYPNFAKHVEAMARQGNTDATR